MHIARIGALVLRAAWFRFRLCFSALIAWLIRRETHPPTHPLFHTRHRPRLAPVSSASARRTCTPRGRSPTARCAEPDSSMIAQKSVRLSFAPTSFILETHTPVLAERFCHDAYSVFILVPAPPLRLFSSLHPQPASRPPPSSCRTRSTSSVCRFLAAPRTNSPFARRRTAATSVSPGATRRASPTRSPI